jgi:hypothetical protein
MGSVIFITVNFIIPYFNIDAKLQDFIISLSIIISLLGFEWSGLFLSEGHTGIGNTSIDYTGINFPTGPVNVNLGNPTPVVVTEGSYNSFNP